MAKTSDIYKNYWYFRVQLNFFCEKNWHKSGNNSLPICQIGNQYMFSWSPIHLVKNKHSFNFVSKLILFKPSVYLNSQGINYYIFLLICRRAHKNQTNLLFYPNNLWKTLRILIRRGLLPLWNINIKLKWL